MAGDVLDANGNCVSTACKTNNNGANCSQTETLFVHKSLDCYNCLVGGGCLDDQMFNDMGHECEDVTGVAAKGAQTGVSRTSLCLQDLTCILKANCASSDVVLCYCGSLGGGNACSTSMMVGAANGACVQQETDATEHTSMEPPSKIVPDLFNQVLGGGKANQIFSCGAACPTCQM